MYKCIKIKLGICWWEYTVPVWQYFCFYPCFQDHRKCLRAVLEIAAGFWPFSDQFQHLADQNPFWSANEKTINNPQNVPSSKNGQPISDSWYHWHNASFLFYPYIIPSLLLLSIIICVNLTLMITVCRGSLRICLQYFVWQRTQWVLVPPDLMMCTHCTLESQYTSY